MLRSEYDRESDLFMFKYKDMKKKMTFFKISQSVLFISVVYRFSFPVPMKFITSFTMVQSAGAVEYTDCIYAEG